MSSLTPWDDTPKISQLFQPRDLETSRPRDLVTSLPGDPDHPPTLDRARKSLRTLVQQEDV
jgi:hypothetical protein